MTATAGCSFDFESLFGESSSYQSAFEISSSDEATGGDPHDGFLEDLEDSFSIFDHFDQICEDDEAALDRGFAVQSKS